jgi:hypothetical protein
MTIEREIEQNHVLNGGGELHFHTTIALQRGTKDRLNKNRAPGQCYDGFVNELIEYWEKYRIGSSLCAPGKPMNQTMDR